MKKLTKIVGLLITFLILMMLLGGCVKSVEFESNTITLSDVAGREVQVSSPAERIVLVSGRHIHEFSALMGDDFAKNIVGWGSDLKAYDKDTYDVFLAAYPEIAEIPDIGYHSLGTFSVEKVISLNPDVVIFPLWLKNDQTATEDMKRLEQAGIPSLFVDFYEDPFGNPVKSMEILGKVTGEEERALEITDFYQKQVNMIYDRLAQMNQPKPTVYVEVGSKGPSEYGNSYGSTGWGAVIEKAGGKNIAEGVIKNSGQINAEYLLKENPEVIIISGSNWEGTIDSMKLGFYAEPEDSSQRLQKFLERPGWHTISAVQNGRVYGIYHGLSFRIYNFAGIQAFAQWIYPGEFADIDPVANLQEFYDRFMPVELSGVWLGGIDGQ